MLLSLKERLVAQGLYPERSNFATQLLVEDIDDKVKLEPTERKKVLKHADPRSGIINWEKVGGKDKKVVFSKAELSLLKERVEFLNTAKNQDGSIGQITQQILSLCKKIKAESEKKESKDEGDK